MGHERAKEERAMKLIILMLSVVLGVVWSMVFFGRLNHRGRTLSFRLWFGEMGITALSWTSNLTWSRWFEILIRESFAVSSRRRDI